MYLGIPSTFYRSKSIETCGLEIPTPQPHSVPTTRLLTSKDDIPVLLHEFPSRLYKFLHFLDSQIDIQRYEAAFGEVDIFGEHVVVEEGLEVRG